VVSVPTPPVNLKAFCTEYATGMLTMSRDAVDGVSPPSTNTLLLAPASSHVRTTVSADA